jgi:hypothetical protein
MKKSLFMISSAAVIIFAESTWLWARPDQAGPTPEPAVRSSETSSAPLAGASSHVTTPATATPLNEPVPTPAFIGVNTPTTVTTQIHISNSLLVPGSVNLLLVPSNGGQPVILGVMQSSANNLYSLQHTFTETTPGDLFLEVSVILRGQLKRILSPIASLGVWEATPTTYTDTSFSITVPSDWTTSVQTSSQGSATNPSKSTVFSLPDQPIPVFYVLTYPHGANVIGQSDDAPGYLGTADGSDFYFQMISAPADASTLTPLALTPTALQQELLEVAKTFQTR